jgi:hypothetical protein
MIGRRLSTWQLSVERRGFRSQRWLGDPFEVGQD